MKEIPEFIIGDIFEDHRGKLRFVNDFQLNVIKRMYLIEHPSTSVIRAWQGHKIEQKWFYVIEGSFELHLVQPDDWVNPSMNLPVLSFELSSNHNGVLHVPRGYANGFRAMQDNSKIIVFSDLDLVQAGFDDFRFDKGLWYKW